MSLTSLSFIGIYFPLLILAYYFPLFKSRKYRNVILLLASIGLYAFAEPIYILFLLSSVAINYSLFCLSDKTGHKSWTVIGICIDVFALAFFKYINQFLAAFTFIGVHISQVAFPIGLSFFTFREISFLVESKKLSRSIKIGFMESALFITNFMTISAGPLGMFDLEINQYTKRKESKEKIQEGICRFATGLIKKIIIADSLQSLVSICFAQHDISVCMAWIGAIAYTLQIYFDFSGYSDMAVGLGKIFGFEFMENFNLPYTATSICDFWKRWHMSLTKWFTRYVYFPLGGSRVNHVYRHILNLLIVWFCTGIWHGSQWTFILWGMIYFVFQTLEKYTKLSRTLNTFHLGHMYTMLIVILCWVIFRSDSIASAFSYIGSMFGKEFSCIICNEDIETVKFYFIPLVAGILFSSTFVNRLKERAQQSGPISIAVNALTLCLFIVSIVLIIGRGYTAPMYAKF